MAYYLFVIGVIVGCIFTLILLRLSSGRGTLRVDHSNPERDIYRLEIDDLDGLAYKKRMLVSIDHNANLS